jgi:TRAP-type C4-dicarboxylate transport system permease small subunit
VTKPFEDVAQASEANYADDLSRFSLRGHGLEDWLCLLLLWSMGALVFTQFFTRYALNDSVAWTEEAARYLLIALTFIGSAGAVRRGGHIRVEVLENALQGRAKRALQAVLDAGRLAFWCFGLWIGFDLAERMGGMPMDSLDATLGWVYWPVCLGFALMAAREAQWIWRRWTRGDAPQSQDVVA